MSLDLFNKKRLYWIAQLSSWSLYITVAGIFNYLSSQRPLGMRIMVGLGIAWITGVGLSHLYREGIIRLGWMRLSIFQLIPRLLPAIVVLGLLFQLVYFITTAFLLKGAVVFDLRENLENTLGWSTILFMWSLLYFLFHFFENYRKEEIKNLTWEANKNEFELNKLKSQLNPHFIFNSMNSIRALVDEEPQKAKKSITQLANILRNTLLMGKKKVIPFDEELSQIGRASCRERV
mgnify:FL=1